MIQICWLWILQSQSKLVHIFSPKFKVQIEVCRIFSSVLNFNKHVFCLSRQALTLLKITVDIFEISLHGVAVVCAPGGALPTTNNKMLLVWSIPHFGPNRHGGISFLLHHRNIRSISSARSWTLPHTKIWMRKFRWSLWILLLRRYQWRPMLLYFIADGNLDRMRQYSTEKITTPSPSSFVCHGRSIHVRGWPADISAEHQNRWAT